MRRSAGQVLAQVHFFVVSHVQVAPQLQIFVPHVVQVQMSVSCLSFVMIGSSREWSEVVVTS
jgi:hypothetical protein